MLLFVGADRDFIYTLYAQNFRRGMQFGLTTRIIFQTLQRSALEKWLNILTTRGGCFFSMALSSPNIPLPERGLSLVPHGSDLFAPRPITSESFHLYSDAAVEETSGGLGGWAHGEYWHFELSPAHRKLLHITAWEFVALGINIIVFGRRLSGAHVYLLVDALAEVHVMLSRAAHSPHRQCIYRIILQLPELAGLGKLRQEAHVFGEINVAADAASRANFGLLKALGKQFGIEVARLQLPERAQQFLDRVRRAVHEPLKKNLRSKIMHTITESCDTQLICLP